MVVLKACIPSVLERVDSVHNGADRACLLAQRSYYWDTLKSDVKEYCVNCVTCKVMSTKPKQEALYLTEAPPAIGHTQAVDFVVVGEKGDRKKVPSLSGCPVGIFGGFPVCLTSYFGYDYSQTHGLLEFDGMAGHVLQ